MKTISLSRVNLSVRVIRIILISVVALMIMAGIVLVRDIEAMAATSSQRFGFVLTEPHPIDQAPPEAAAGLRVPVAIEQGPLPWRSLPEIQAEVPFTIPQPGWLPEGLALRGAMAGSGLTGDDRPVPMQIILRYDLGDEVSGKSLLLNIFSQPKIEGGIVVAASAVRDVTVNGRPAALVAGAWAENQQWVASATDKMLSWSDGAYTYILSASGAEITVDDLLRVAESVK